MGDRTGIEWTRQVSANGVEMPGATWNPVTGCDKVSQGCKNCYAKRLWPRLKALPNSVYTGRDFTDVATHPERLVQPMLWTRPRRIFVNSLSDLFHESVPWSFIAAVFCVMALSPQHTFQILTKRPQRMRDFFDWIGWDGRHGGGPVAICLAKFLEVGAGAPTAGVRRKIERLTAELRASSGGQWSGGQWPLPNVWLGVSVEDQPSTDERVPLLLKTPASVRWISAEPLIRSVEARQWLHGIDWVVAGGESGPRARPMHPDWARSLRDQCEAAGVKFFFKQWGEWEVASTANGHFDSSMVTSGAQWVHLDGLVNGPGFYRDDGLEVTSVYAMLPVGKKKSGRALDGRMHDEFPD